MDMIEYVRAIKCGFRDQYGFIPCGGTKSEPIFDIIPDGKYPMVIDGKKDKVKIVNGMIHCGRFM